MIRQQFSSTSFELGKGAVCLRELDGNDAAGMTARGQREMRRAGTRAGGPETEDHRRARFGWCCRLGGLGGGRTALTGAGSLQIALCLCDAKSNPGTGLRRSDPSAHHRQRPGPDRRSPLAE